jgi:predicted amidophosphoribosyltransferase
MKLGFIEFGRKDACANCGAPTTQWLSLGNATAPTCDRCKREVAQAMQQTPHFDPKGRTFGPHEQWGDH